MKAKTLFLSSIILGGFVTPIVQSTTTTDAITINTEVKEKQTVKSATVKNNQVQREAKIKLGEKTVLKDLNSQTSIVIAATTKNEQNKLADIYVNLDDSQIKKLQDNKEVEFNVPELKTKSSWNGDFEYQSIVPTMKLSFDDDSQSFKLTKTDNTNKLDHLTYNLIKGDALVHYVYKDTKEEIYAGKHEDVFSDKRNDFEVDLLESFDDAPLPVGHFDALNIDFDALDPEDKPLNPLNPSFHEQPVKIDYEFDNINPDNTEYTVYLEKAKPTVIEFIVYLDNKVYDQKTIVGEINTTIPLQNDEKLPDKSVAHLNNAKTKFTLTNEYFTQLGVSTISGKAFHQTVFDRDSDIPREKDFLNKTILFANDDNTAEEPTNIDPSLTGSHKKMELFYESNSNDENNSTDNTVTADVTIPSNLGDKVVSKVTGKIGDTIDVTVPEVTGYTADKKTVKATVGKDGKITTNEKVTYTKNPTDTDNNQNNQNNGNSNNGNNGNDSIKPPVITPMPQPSDFDGFVGTMKNDVRLHKLSNGNMSLTNDRALAKHSDWKANSLIKVDGIKYYQVGNNEWVKASDVYRYELKTGVVNTKDSEFTKLVQSDASDVTSRGLAAKTSWYYDRVAYLGDKEEKHYRVATHEFVHEQSVTEK